MNILILGGRTKFGAHLYEMWSDYNHDVLAVGRQDLDFDSGWVIPLQKLIVNRFGSTDLIDVVIVNVYDHGANRSDVQGRVLETMWKLLNKHRVTFVVMGSIAYHYEKTEYALAKKSLAAQCKAYSDQNTQAGLILVEPGVLENNRHIYPNSKWMAFSTLSNIIYGLLYSSARFIQLTIKGSEAPTKVNNAHTRTSDSDSATA